MENQSTKSGKHFDIISLNRLNVLEKGKTAEYLCSRFLVGGVYEPQFHTNLSS